MESFLSCANAGAVIDASWNQGRIASTFLRNCGASPIDDVVNGVSITQTMSTLKIEVMRSPKPP